MATPSLVVKHVQRCYGSTQAMRTDCRWARGVWFSAPLHGLADLHSAAAAGARALLPPP